MLISIYRRPRVVTFVCIAIASLTDMSTALAQTRTDLGQIVITPTRSPQASLNLISDVDSRSTESLRDRGAHSVADGLGMMSGLSLSANGGPASTSALFVRGASAGQTLTLIDGFRLASVSLGQPTYEALPLMLTDRIEVLRGPGSAYYGADALGGVVQLFTPRAAVGRRVFGEAAIGNESSRRLVGGISAGSGGLTASLRISREQSDGYNVTRPNYFAFNPDADGFERDGLVANLSANLSENTGLRLVFLRNELDTQYDDGAFVDARTLTRTELTGLTLDHVLADQTLVELRLGRSKDRSESISSFSSVYVSTQDQFSASARKAVTAGIELAINYERLEQDVETAAYLPNVVETRTTNSYGIALVGRDGPHILQLSARSDDSNQYGNQANGTLNYGYVLPSGIRIGGAYATGFRAPGFNSLYFPGYGRPTIKPERSRNVELGLYLDRQTNDNPKTWSGKFVAYSNAVRDLIVYAPVCPDPDPQFEFGCADNVNRARLRGISMALGRQHGPFAWRLNADIANPVDQTLGNVLARRSKRQLRLAIDYRLGKWLFGADLRGESSRFDDAANTVRLPGYGLINLSVRRRMASGWTAFLSVANAGDKDYTTAAGFRPQGRLGMMGLRYQPKNGG